ncbi:MAG: hypothetical protein HZA10_06050 [Nitrospirae bacterium]|nr:hypothetical protein [Nitrospirota bacterium]
MSRTLIIFEFKDEVDSFIARRSIEELRKEDTYVLAILPEAQLQLKRNGIRFFTTYELFGREGHEQALLKSDEIYKFCESLLTIEDELRITQGYNITVLFYLRTFIHYFLWLIEIIYRACLLWNIEQIIAFSRDGSYSLNPYLSDSEGYAGTISKRISEKLCIAHELMQGVHISRNPAAGAVKKNASDLCKFLIYKLILSMSSLLKARQIIIAPSMSYNFQRVINELMPVLPDARVLYLADKNPSSILSFLFRADGDIFFPLPVIGGKKQKRFKKTINQSVQRLWESAGSDEIFSYRGISVKEIVFKKIRDDIVSTISNIHNQTLHLNGFLKKLRPAIIISQMARFMNYNLGELASLYNIPSLLVSHGSHVPPKNQYEMMEWKEHGLGLVNTRYQYIAVQSPWARAYLQEISTRSTHIITGPLLFAKVNKNENTRVLLRKKLLRGYENKIILLHADTPRLHNDLRFYVYQTVDEYIGNLNSLISAVEKVSDLHLIIRFRPKDYLSKNDLESLLVESDCYDIHTEGSFEEYLSLSDMLVSYSSTTIEEALQNRIPVLQYDPTGKYCHIPCQILAPETKPEPDSCYYVNSADNFPWALNWLIKNHFHGTVPEAVWAKHVFDDKEIVKLSAYFKDLLIRK